MNVSHQYVQTAACRGRKSEMSELDFSNLPRIRAEILIQQRGLPPVGDRLIERLTALLETDPTEVSAKALIEEMVEACTALGAMPVQSVEAYYGEQRPQRLVSADLQAVADWVNAKK